MNPAHKVIANVTWYRDSSFYISDRRVANYHKLLDRVSTLHKLVNEAICDLYWGGEDFTISAPKGDDTLTALQNDLEEYEYLLQTYRLDTDALLAELVAADISRNIN